MCFGACCLYHVDPVGDSRAEIRWCEGDRGGFITALGCVVCNKIKINLKYVADPATLLALNIVLGDLIVL